MSKDLRTYFIINAEDVVNNQTDDYKFKYLNKKQKKIKIFSKRDFKKYNKDNEARVVGNIRKRQVHYTNYADDKLLKKAKRKKGIIACAKLQMPSNISNNNYIKDNYGNVYKCFDVKEANKVHSYGYAYVGNNEFLRVTTLNPLLFLIFFIILGILICCMIFSPEKPNNNINIEDGIVITDNNNETTPSDKELWYFEPFNEVTTLTKDNKEIVLKNLEINEGKYLCSYEIIVDGKSIHTTGAILPNNAVKYDLWSQLDEGTYTLVCRSTTYDINTYEAYGGHYNLSTTLVVEK